jgi:hypothetical protein
MRLRRRDGWQWREEISGHESIQEENLRTVATYSRIDQAEIEALRWILGYMNEIVIGVDANSSRVEK